MTAAEVLAQIQAAGIPYRVVDQQFEWRPGEISLELREAVSACKKELARLAARGDGFGSPVQSALAMAVVRCSACGECDYLPLDDGWRRCWGCGRRWGVEGDDPGDPADLDAVAAAAGVGRCHREDEDPAARALGDRMVEVLRADGPTAYRALAARLGFDLLDLIDAARLDRGRRFVRAGDGAIALRGDESAPGYP